MSTVRMVVLVHVLTVFLLNSKSNGIKWPSYTDVTLDIMKSENCSSENGLKLNDDRSNPYIVTGYSDRILSNKKITSRQYSEDPAVYDSRIGLFLFTRYCGPGSRIWQKIFPNGEKTYSDIDRCCKLHDSCPNFVEKKEHYEQYPGLEIRPQFFSRLQCRCDSEFYKCLKSLKTPYAKSVAVGYAVFQRFCLELEHPIEGCIQYHSAYGLKRCEIYHVNNNLPKTWQWFDVLPPYANFTEFPQIVRGNLV